MSSVSLMSSRGRGRGGLAPGVRTIDAIDRIDEVGRGGAMLNAECRMSRRRGDVQCTMHNAECTMHNGGGRGLGGRRDDKKTGRRAIGPRFREASGGAILSSRQPVVPSSCRRRRGPAQGGPRTAGSGRIGLKRRPGRGRINAESRMQGEDERATCCRGRVL